MPDYDLTRLGSRAFEQMIVALAHAELGPGLQAFGDGRDGGREAVCEVPIDWSRTSVGGTSTWSGKTVFQAKFQVKPKPEPHDNAVWLQKEIGKEIDGWVKAKRNSSRNWFPDQIVFVTNVDLSPVAKAGGIDLLDTYIRNRIGSDSDAYKAGLHIKHYRIWHADQVRTMLDANQSVRWAYPGLLSVGDILSLLGDSSTPWGTFGLDDPLRDEMLRALQSDQWIRLGQAGASSEEKLHLHDVLIDLPVSDEEGGSASRALREVLALGDQNLRRRESDPESHVGLVFVGGPGQGKSTLSQAVAQAYRSSLLDGADLGPGAAVIVNSTKSALSALNIPLPGNRRWPVRVDLAKYSEELVAGSDTSLLRWIATEASKKIESDLSPAKLRQWLRAWPWALILDGLDEVPSAHARRLLRAQIDNLLVTAEDTNADLLILITTRPTGYDERFDADTYRHWTLNHLPADDAASFAKRLVNVRLSSDPDMRDKVVDRMSDVAADSSTRRLMQTPLQVTIMSLIVEKYPNLPPDRFTLFNLYYTTIFDREVGKDIPVARFLAQNRQQIDRLHESVGLRLQVLAEYAEGAEAVLPVDELTDLVNRQLTARGFGRERAAESTAVLVDAAMSRLVLLVPREEGVGFEVRTLQEMMAARALTASDDVKTSAWMVQISHSPHWRNTWLLAAGRLLSRSERFEQVLIHLLKGLDTDSRRLAAKYKTAPALAAQLLDDNLAFMRPRFEQALVQIVLSQLSVPPTLDLIGPAHACLRLLSGDYWEAAVARFKSALSGDDATRATALVLLDRIMSFRNLEHRGSLNALNAWSRADETQAEAARRWLEVAHGARHHVDAFIPLGEYLLQWLDFTAFSEAEEDDFKGAVSALNSVLLESRESPFGDALLVVSMGEWADPTPFVRQLDDEARAISVEMTLESLPPRAWSAISGLSAIVLSELNRTPVGREIWEDVLATEASESDF